MTVADQSTSTGRPDGLAPTPKRRRPRQVAAGVAIVAASCVGGAFLYGSVRETESVIAIAQMVERGAVIGEGDLAVIDLGAGSDLDTVDGSRIDEFAGQRAAVDLTPGTVLTSTSVTTIMVPVGDAALVPVALPRTRLTNEQLVPGDQVQVVLTPATGQEIPEDLPAINATVSTVGSPDASDTVVVDLLVAPADAPTLTVRAATGRVALVLKSRDREGGAE